MKNEYNNLFRSHIDTRIYEVNFKYYQHGTPVKKTGIKIFDYRNDALDFKKKLIEAQHAIEAGEKNSSIIDWVFEVVFKLCPDTSGYLVEDQIVVEKVETTRTVIK